MGEKHLCNEARYERGFPRADGTYDAYVYIAARPVHDVFIYVIALHIFPPKLILVYGYAARFGDMQARRVLPHSAAIKNVCLHDG